MAHEDPLAAVGGAGGRGRARSGAMHSEVDDEMVSDLDRLHASLEGREPPPVPKRAAAPPASAISSSGTGPTLSRKTIKVLTDLATAEPGAGAADRRRVETEEEAAERELAELERRRRANEAAAAAVTAVAAPAHAAAPSHAAAGAGGGALLAGVRMRKAADDKDYDVMIKLLLLGDGGVGKTSLMLRFSEDKFSQSLLSTAGVDYKTQHLEVDSAAGGKKIKLQIWDTAGQTRFHTITQAYYKAAHGIVLIYDVSDGSESSFHNVRYWMENITKHANAHTQRILIGNKSDVKGKKVRVRPGQWKVGGDVWVNSQSALRVLGLVQVDTARGKALADEYHMKFFETSAKDGTNVKEAFYTIARDVVMKMMSGETPVDGASAPAGPGGKAGKGKDCSVQ